MGSEKLTTAKCSADVIRWIIANEHHEGWWEGPVEARTAFVLKGPQARLIIPSGIHQPGLMDGDNYRATKRMYRPTPAGRAALREATE